MNKSGNSLNCYVLGQCALSDLHITKLHNSIFLSDLTFGRKDEWIVGSRIFNSSLQICKISHESVLNF